MNYNRCIIGGRLTADAEQKVTQSGKAVCSFSVAVNRAYGENKCDFFDVVAWGDTAVLVAKYFSKGSNILVEGRIEMRQYETSDGQKRKVTELIADRVVFVDPKKETDAHETPAAPAPSYSSAPRDAFGVQTFLQTRPRFEDVNPDDLPF